MNALPLWPCAYPTPAVQALFKQQPADFCVFEIPLSLPQGEGEHVWLEVEKRSANTAWIAGRIATLAGVAEMDVGYAGLKDRHAITRQWFSVYLPKGDTPDFSQLNDEEMTVLSQQRHSKKLRRGDLLGNRFVIRLRQVTMADEAAYQQLQHNLAAVQQHGVPNYFGEQRFGHDGGNIEAGRAMLAGEIRVRNRQKKSIYLSAIRSLIFNEVVAARIQAGLWGEALDGDVLVHEQATGPLWGRGRLTSQDQTLQLETDVAARYADMCNGLEHAGLQQERRALAALPSHFQWRWLAQNEEQSGRTELSTSEYQQAHDLELSFSLAAGYYATSIIRELMQINERAVTP